MSPLGKLSGFMHKVQIGLIGGGTVGGGVIKALKNNGRLIASRTGVELKVSAVAVKDKSRKRSVPIAKSLLTEDWREVIANDKISVIAEVMGGTTIARRVVVAALKAGKSIVTANKALLAEHGEELFELARKHGANIYYEAAVAGGIPIIKVLRESLAANRVTRLYGIVNGTCNYILSRMKDEGAAFDDVLTDAQQLGYAEAEPSLDIDGDDAWHKTALMATLTQGFWVDPKKVHLEGIRGISQLDIQFAEVLGYTVRLLGIVKAGEGKGKKALTQIGVYPALVPNDHVLAGINGVNNAILVRGDIAGDTLYYGPGAGQDATASSVVSDLIDAALDIKTDSGCRVPPFETHNPDGGILPIGETVSSFYIRLSVVDKPGTLARISKILGDSGIGISSVIQPEGHEGTSVPLILMIHNARDAAMSAALKKIGKLSVIKGSPIMYRVEHFD